jgi:hypothetical protein
MQSISPLVLVAALLGVTPAVMYAQRAGQPREQRPSCDGKIVSAVDIRPGRPPFEGASTKWRNMARAVGLHHATTEVGVIDAFVLLNVGDRCTEARRAESERILRAQPYLANATVHAIPDDSGGVRLLVETVDEVPVLVAGQFHGINPQSFSLGNSNVGGEGLLLQANVEKGFGVYRTGLGFRLAEYAAFGRPYVASVEVQRHTLGNYANVDLAHPFYTDLQRAAWHVGYTQGEDYLGVSRAARDPLNLIVNQHRWEASAIARVFGTRTIGVLGLAATGLRLTPDTAGVIVSDSGLVADTGTTLHNRYMPFRSTRVGILGGARRESFVTVHGFDALTAAQDVPSGWAAGLYVAHGLKAMGENDSFLSGVVYLGAANEQALLSTLVQMEARRDDATSKWDSGIGSARTALYVGSAPGVVMVLENKLSMGTGSRLPMQLTLGDFRGGIIGYRNASIAGSQRNASRAEFRFSRPAVMRNADLGVATFGEIATIRAGDAPYGVNATRASVGISLLGAYPSGSKRLYRADIGFPFTRTGSGGGQIEVRFTSEDRTGTYWREPDDVSRARTGAVPATLFALPTH